MINNPIPLFILLQIKMSCLNFVWVWEGMFKSKLLMNGIFKIYCFLTMDMVGFYTFFVCSFLPTSLIFFQKINLLFTRYNIQVVFYSIFFPTLIKITTKFSYSPMCSENFKSPVKKIRYLVIYLVEFFLVVYHSLFNLKFNDLFTYFYMESYF